MQRFDLSDEAQREAGIAAAALAVQRGQLVALPTDTVYGVGADAFDRKAVAAVLAAKGRGRDMPPPVLVPHVRALDGLAADVPACARELVAAFWPGPLTLVCRAQPSLDWDLGDTHGTVALRMPLHRVALEVLEKTGPLAVTSANRTGSPAATTCDEAVEMLGDAVSIYLDAGPSPSSVASTIIDVTGDVPRVLRAGPLEADRLLTVVPDLRLFVPEG
jgi:L-threonylcarbamoyladenylate synthase